ncbi:MAG TPA: methyltransferase domain-containing protein [Acidimicrobiales bacterium]|nr:methyltransferase domain-containing protein [Acidimicrobiales bacterium]
MEEISAIPKGLGADDLRRNREYLKRAAYADDVLFRERLSLYDYQQPRIDLVAEVLAHLGELRGATVLDVGCGNGQYHDGLVRAGARVVGLDLSTGMLAAARSVHGGPLAAADAAALPVADGRAGAALAMHMLYHLPNPAGALAELARVLRPGGRLVVAIGGERHLKEAAELWLPLLAEEGVDADVRDAGFVQGNLWPSDLDALLGDYFGDVQMHLLASTIVLPDPGPLVRHAVTTSAWRVGQEQGARMAERFAAELGKVIDRSGIFTLTTEVALFSAVRP